MTTFTLHVTINYPTNEMEQTHEKALAEYVAKLIESYLMEPTPSSWVFTVSREQEP
jgi:hypothetical protein